MQNLQMQAGLLHVDAVDDNELKNIVEQRLSAPFTSIKVELDDL